MTKLEDARPLNGLGYLADDDLGDGESEAFYAPGITARACRNSMDRFYDNISLWDKI